VPEYTSVRAELSKSLEEAVEEYVARTGSPDVEEVFETVDNIGRRFAIELLRDTTVADPNSADYQEELRRTKDRLIEGALRTALS